MIDAILEPIAEPSYSSHACAVYHQATPAILSHLRKKHFHHASANITNLSLHSFDKLPFEKDWTDANHYLCLWVNDRPSVYAGWIYNDQVISDRLAAWITVLQGVHCTDSIARHEKPFPPLYWAAGLVRCVEELSQISNSSMQNPVQAAAITPAAESLWFTFSSANVSLAKKQKNMRRFYDATAIGLGYQLIRAGARTYIECDGEEMSQPPKINLIYAKDLL